MSTVAVREQEDTMAIKWERVQAGQTLYDIHRERAGNTSMTRVGCWEVAVVSIDHAAGTARVRWNHNAEETWRRYQIIRLFAKKPSSYLKAVERERARGW